MKRELRTSKAPSPIGPYSQAIESGAVYLSGQVGINPVDGNLEDGIVRQTARVISNIEEVLKSDGMGLLNVVRTTVFLVDLTEFPKMNEEYSKHFSSPFPARSTVQVTALPRGARVEIDAIAVR
jgi:2-iminobutanoate/2-iminopropanoate deaminase